MDEAECLVSWIDRSHHLADGKQHSVGEITGRGYEAEEAEKRAGAAAMRMLIIVSALLLSIPVLAEPRCAQFGDAPDHIDPDLAPKIIKWVTGVEDYLDVPRPLSKIAALQLQANVGNWKETARSTLIDSIFISAVEHGVNVQYETLMITADADHARDHQHWVERCLIGHSKSLRKPRGFYCHPLLDSSEAGGPWRRELFKP